MSRYDSDRHAYEQECTESMIRMRDPSYNIRRKPVTDQKNDRAQPVADDAAMPDEIIAYIDTRFSEPHQHSWITKNDNPDALSDRPHAKYIRAALRQPAAADNREDTTYLISVLTDIREKTGVGSKPMLSELADAIVQKYAADNRGVDVEAWEQIDMDMDVLKDCIPNRQDRETFLTSIHNRVKAIIQKAKS